MILTLERSATMFEDFERHLRTQDRPSTTIRSYLSDLRQFASWFQQTNGERPTLQTITPTDLREYRQYMLTVQRLSPNTINRRLASLSAYLNWGKQAGRIREGRDRRFHGGRETASASGCSVGEADVEHGPARGRGVCVATGRFAVK